MTAQVFVLATQAISQAAGPAYAVPVGAANTALVSQGVDQPPIFSSVPGSSPVGAPFSTQYNNAGSFAGAGPGTAGQVLTSNGAAAPTFQASNGRLSALLQDVKASGNPGGAAATATWNVRALNTIAFDQTSSITLVANQFTLPAGTWDIVVRAPALQCFANKVRLVNVTDSTNVYGGNAWSDASATAAQVDATLHALATLAAPKTFQIEHYTESNAGGATYVLGARFNVATIPEIYCEVYLQKVL